MPNYQYRCKSCQYEFEKLQAFGEAPITECPKCQGMVVRVLTPPNFQFKGGKPSAKRTHKGQPIHQAEEGHWIVDGLDEPK